MERVTFVLSTGNKVTVTGRTIKECADKVNGQIVAMTNNETFDGRCTVQSHSHDTVTTVSVMDNIIQDAISLYNSTQPGCEQYHWLNRFLHVVQTCIADEQLLTNKEKRRCRKSI
jgi:hypothetical protein